MAMRHCGGSAVAMRHGGAHLGRTVSNFKMSSASTVTASARRSSSSNDSRYCAAAIVAAPNEDAHRLFLTQFLEVMQKSFLTHIVESFLQPLSFCGIMDNGANVNVI